MGPLQSFQELESRKNLEKLHALPKAFTNAQVFQRRPLGYTQIETTCHSHKP